MRLGRGRRPVPLARAAAACPLGPGRAATDGLAAAGPDRAGGLTPYWYLAFLPGVPLCLVVYFFRDPLRRSRPLPACWWRRPTAKLSRSRVWRTTIYRRPGRSDRHLPVDLQRTLESGPAESRVIALRYSPGQFLNALNPQCAIRNENTWIGLEEESPPHRRMVVRQISGAIARRIVCDLRPGEAARAGAEVRHDQVRLAHRVDRCRQPDLTIEVAIGQESRPARPSWPERAGSIAPDN